MLANFLNKSKPINFISLLVFFFLVFLTSLFTHFFNGVYTSTQIVDSIFFSAVFILIFFLASFVSSKNNLTFDNSYAFFFFVLLTSLFIKDLFSVKTLSVFLIYLLVLRKVYSLRSQKKVIEKVFDVGFWLGVLFLLEPLSFLFFVLIYLGIYFHNKLNINTLIIPVLGFLVPLLLFFTYHFWYDTLHDFYNLFELNLNVGFKDYAHNKGFILLMIVYSFTILGLVIKSSKALSINNTFRRSWILILFNFFLSILFAFLSENKSFYVLVFTLFPTAVIMANTIELINKSVFRNVLVYIFLTGCVFSLFFL